jgi:mannose-1-phosphate guanylyltransferase
MFVWKAKTILAHLRNFLPDSAEPLKRITDAWDGPNQAKALSEWFPKMPKISIDFAVMEKAPNVHAIMLDCRWLDLGSLAALADIIKADENRNIIVAGKSELLECSNSIIATEDDSHLIAGIGLKDIVVVHTPDATLVCPIEHAHRLKELLTLIERHGGEQYL